MSTPAPDLDPSRCPDCGHYWPAHFTTDNSRPKVLGCRPNAAALRDAIGRTPVLIRRGRWGPFAGRVLVTFRDCRDAEAGTVLALDLAAEQYHELDAEYVQNATGRLGGLDLENAKDRLELWLGYAVRVVGR